MLQCLIDLCLTSIEKSQVPVDRGLALIQWVQFLLNLYCKMMRRRSRMRWEDEYFTYLSRNILERSATSCPTIPANAAYSA